MQFNSVQFNFIHCSQM